MKALFNSKKNWELVLGGFEKSVNTTNWSNAPLKALKEVHVKDKTTLYILYQAVDEFEFEKIISIKFSKEA